MNEFKSICEICGENFSTMIYQNKWMCFGCFDKELERLDKVAKEIKEKNKSKHLDKEEFIRILKEDLFNE